MINNTIKKLGITAVFIGTASITPTALAEDDLFQDAGSWAQVVGEGSLRFIDQYIN